MSKYLNVPNGDYKVTVRPGGSIYLDTGFEVGTVEISGNLLVRGETTTINTAELTIEDNIITLNSGETGAGITLNEAGFKIDRGQLPDAFFKYDEDVSGFISINEASQLIRLATNQIDSRSQELLLNAGSNTVNVNPTVDYERKVFTYDGFGNLTGYNPAKADVIPNAQSVVDYVAFNFANVFLRQIGDGNLTISSIEIDDEENTGVDSVITFKIDGNIVSQVYADRWEFDQLRITGTTIETIANSSSDLVLRANGSGNIRIDDMLHINSVPSAGDPTLIPAFPTDGIKLYVNDQYTGKTGIFFANAEQNRDELVSKNRALLFGMLF
jgi:hypothetical protein